MVYNRDEVVQRALSANGTANTPGMCQAWTRGIIGVSAVGDVDGDGDADAIDGWLSEPASRRHFDRKPPAGVPVAWSGGRSGFGHRAVSVGNGRIASTDAGGRGIIAIRPLEWFETNWGMTYLGWSETMSGIPIPKVPQSQSRFDAISWNVNHKNDVDRVRAAITEMATKHSPDVIYLYESVNLFDHLNGLGYKAHQLKPRVKRKGRTSNNGNVLALVRNNLTVSKSWATHMRENWVGPRIGQPQAPRVYRSLKIKKRGVDWKAVGIHFPFGSKARHESVTWVRKVVARRLIDPIIVFGDFNFTEAHVAANIANRSSAKVAGSKIDLAVYKNCTLVAEKVLGNYGSDHSARYYRFVE